MDDAAIRQALQRDRELSRLIPATAEIEHLHKIELEEAIRLSSEYPRLFRNYKGRSLYAAQITYQEALTGLWRHRVIFINEKKKILLLT
nr:hypothetical protein [Candidatus Sigynarchaeota archaeon]